MFDFIYGIGFDDYVIYDIETYPNIFTFAAINNRSKQKYIFEISDRRNDFNELVSFIKAANQYSCKFVGFNNLHFDYPVMHELLNKFDGEWYDVSSIYAKAMSIIKSDWNNRFAHTIYEDHHLFYNIDLLKIHHFDNQARATSLKKLEFAMRMNNVEDLPFDVGIDLNDQQKDTLIEYNHHDCKATDLFFEQSKKQIDFRNHLTKTYGRDFTNFNDTKIGKDYFITELEKTTPGCCYVTVDGKKKKVQTVRDIIHVKDVVFDYINFNNPIFKRLLDWFKDFSLTETKGVFEYIDVPYDMAVNMDKTKIKVFGLDQDNIPKMLKTEKYEKWKSPRLERLINNGVPFQDCFEDMEDQIFIDQYKFISGKKDEGGLNCIVNGFQFDFGTGGIHGSVTKRKILNSENSIIIDIDVKSYYPNIAIQNKLHPAHLGQTFCSIYESLFKQRLAAQKASQQEISDMLKLALNGVYGDSNSAYSPLYDPQYTMAVTINGQLMLCMLAEALMQLESLELLQINTDGLTVKLPMEYRDWLMNVCKWWESITKLTLEYAEYDAMYIRDVNNYLAVYANTGDEKKYKRKGAYEFDRQWHQNHSHLVVAKAANAYLTENIDIETFIVGHVDVYDFMILGKVPGNSYLELDKQKVSSTVRYYISDDGGKLEKVMPPTGEIGKYKRKSGITNEFYETILAEVGDNHDERIHTKNKSTYEYTRTELQAGCKVTLCNNMTGVDVFSNIDYQWYIDEATKLVQLSGE